MTAADRDRIVTEVQGIVATTRLPGSTDDGLNTGLTQDQFEADLAAILEAVRFRLPRWRRKSLILVR